MEKKKKINNYEIRTIIKIGQSTLGIGLPKKILKDLNIGHKDIIKVEKNGDYIFLSKYDLKE